MRRSRTPSNWKHKRQISPQESIHAIARSTIVIRKQVVHVHDGVTCLEEYQEAGLAMRKFSLGTIALVVLLAIGGLGIWIAATGALRREWFQLLHQQQATILRLRETPPAGWDSHAWENVLVMVHNVWGNVTYHPDYSHISVEEMRHLQQELEDIVARATPQSSVECVDQVYDLLQRRGEKTEFIAGFRDEFRTQVTGDVP